MIQSLINEVCKLFLLFVDLIRRRVLEAAAQVTQASCRHQGHGPFSYFSILFANIF